MKTKMKTKKGIISLAILASLSLFAKAQSSFVRQPDSAKIYFDTTANPQWYYGGVWDFRCSYDSDGLLTRLLVEVVHGSDCVTRDYNYQYDANHNVVSSEYNGYDCESSGIRYKTENEFLDNLIRCQTRYVFAVNRWWTFQDSTYYQYDGTRRLSYVESFNEDHMHSSTVRYEYGDHEKVIVTEKPNNGLWEPVKRVSQTYSDSDQLLSSLTETCNDGVFTNDVLVTYSYDEQGHCTYVLTQKWENESWMNVKSVSNSYDDNGQLLMAELRKWQDGAFVDANRAIYELDEAGSPVVVRFEKWDGNEWIEGVWVSDFYVYSEDYLSRQNKELCMVDVRRIEIHYTTTPEPGYDVKEHPTEKEFFTVHPNPTTGMFTVTGENLQQAEVFNMLGQKLLGVKGKGDELHIDMADLPAGVYFVTITNEEGRRCVRKVVKK